jgi:(heptosyl)LPS beta-1,4-glucosyltransferase
LGLLRIWLQSYNFRECGKVEQKRHLCCVNTAISVVIISRNEALNIGRCLDAMEGLSDDIVVVDALSEDATPTICKERGVRFHSREWQGYAAQKNYANSLAQHPYILSIDADEVLSKELTKALKAEMQAGLSGAYSFNRLTNYCGHWVRYGGWYPDVKIRLFPKAFTSWQGEFVHETLIFSPEQRVKHLKGDLLHYSYRSAQEHRQRADKYSLLTAQKMKAKGRKAGLLKPWLSGAMRFVDMYLFKLGFLDGRAGFQIATISAASNVFKYKKLREMWRLERK